MFNRLRNSLEKINNHAGGVGFKLSPKMELVSLLITGLNSSKYYESLDDRSQRLLDLINITANDEEGLEFVVKALIYVRTVVGQRSSTHLAAAALAKHVSSTLIGKKFYSKRDRLAKTGGIVYRLDDMLEIAAAYYALNPGKNITSAMKKGFRSALEDANRYELAKYQSKSRQVSLVDMIGVVHPRPDDDMVETFEELISGKLKQFNTVEDRNTTAGQEIAAKVSSGEISEAEAEVQVTEAKKENFAELISKRHIGYLALIRNLRNILKFEPDRSFIKDICSMITDEEFIRRSMVFPHQIDLALDVLAAETSFKPSVRVLESLSQAYDLAIPNLAQLFPEGKTAVIVDTSGSMSSTFMVKFRPIEKAALIGATLAKE